MKRVCMLLLCLTLCLGPVQSLGQGTDAGYLQGYLTDLSQGENLDTLYACLDATMQAALSREDFASLWGQLAAISGEFLGFDGDTESTAMGEYLVLTQRLDMTGMDLMCTMSLDASGKVAGLQFTPAPATADETAPSAGVTEEAIQVGEAPWELPGLLTLPENAQGPLPAVVLVQGSGPSDRNESVGAVKPFYDLAQALAAQGFKGGSRGDTEWNQWVQSEKEQLAAVMERHGIEWEHKGTHEKHLSVLDYKKQEREKEINALEDKLAEKKDEFRVMADRIENFDNGERALKKLDESIMNEPEYQLPEPSAMMSARSYKAKFVEPLIAKLKSLIKTLFARYFKAIDSYNRLNVTNRNLYRENEKLSKINGKLTEENTRLRAENKDYSLLRRVFGHKQIDSLLEQARNLKGQKRDHTRSR